VVSQLKRSTVITLPLPFIIITAGTAAQRQQQQQQQQQFAFPIIQWYYPKESAQ
jgi:hypothetical protein